MFILLSVEFFFFFFIYLRCFSLASMKKIKFLIYENSRKIFKLLKKSKTSANHFVLFFIWPFCQYKLLSGRQKFFKKRFKKFLRNWKNTKNSVNRLCYVGAGLVCHFFFVFFLFALDLIIELLVICDWQLLTECFEL